MMKLYTVTAFLLFLTTTAFSNSDSLKNIINNSSDIEQRWRASYLYSKSVLSEHPDSAYKYTISVVKDSSINPSSEHLGNCLNLMSVYYFYRSQYDSVIFYSQKAIKIFHSQNIKTENTARYNMALALRNLGNYQSALGSFFEILDFYKKDSNNIRIAGTLNDIGNTYAYLKDYGKSIEYQKQALTYLKADDYQLNGNIYNSLGYIFSAIDKNDSSIIYYRKSLKFKEKGGSIWSIINTQNNLCTLIDYKTSPVECEECLLSLLKNLHKINDFNGIARTYLNLSVKSTYYSQCNKAESRIDSAAYYIKFSKDIYLLQKYYKLYAATLRKCGKPEFANLYLDSLINLNDSIFDIQKQQEIMELDTKYQTQQKEESIKLLNVQNELNLVKIDNQKQQLFFLIFIAAIIIIGGITSFLLFKQRQRKLRELAIIKMREKERIRIARDMHDEIGSGLTRISFMSEQIKLQKDKLISKNDISKIIEQSRYLSKNLREIIWALDPTNDKLDELLFYMRDYINEFSENTGIECKIDFPENKEDIEVASEIRRNLFLALKEILNNIAKHADAKNVRLKFYLKNKLAYLIVKDNGNGFNEKTITRGVGLNSIKARTESLTGVFELKSEIGKGTTIKMKSMIINTTKV